MERRDQRRGAGKSPSCRQREGKANERALGEAGISYSGAEVTAPPGALC